MIQTTLHITEKICFAISALTISGIVLLSFYLFKEAYNSRKSHSAMHGQVKLIEILEKEFNTDLPPNYEKHKLKTIYEKKYITIYSFEEEDGSKRLIIAK